MKPAAAGDQALTMNSQRSAWTPVLAGLSQPMQAKEKSEAYTDELNSLSDCHKILVRPLSLLPRILLRRCTFTLVIRRLSTARTPPPPPREGNAAGPYFNAVDCRQFAAAGRHLLRD
jgi:hypothetical protein